MGQSDLYSSHRQGNTSPERLEMNGILTVGELKKVIAKYSDETQIVTTGGEFFLNISGIVEPDGENTLAITLETSDTFDPRQF